MCLTSVLKAKRISKNCTRPSNRRWHPPESHPHRRSFYYLAALWIFNPPQCNFQEDKRVTSSFTAYSQSPGTPSLFLRRHFGPASSAEGGFRSVHQPSLRSLSHSTGSGQALSSAERARFGELILLDVGKHLASVGGC